MGDGAEKGVSGTWFGNYYYSRVPDAQGFEAVFLQSGAEVEGSILDDGRLGEARVSGKFACGQLSFSKIYNSTALQPVRYDGTLGEDGKSLAGTWRINDVCFGSWKAWKVDEEEFPETAEKAEKELVFVAPAKSR
jgi:hypothetical protein